MRNICFCLVPAFLILLISFQSLGAEPGTDREERHYEMGVFSFERGDWQTAESQFRTALKIAPNHPYSLLYLGKTLVKTGRQEDAMRSFQNALAIDPEIHGLKYEIASLYDAMNDHERATAMFLEIVRQDPENVLARYHAGINLYRQKKYGEALEHLTVASERSPTIRENGYYYAGICHLKTGNVGNASEMFEYVRTHSESRLLRDNSEIWLDAIDKRKKQLKPYRLFLKIGRQYDDNVRLEPEDSDVSLNADKDSDSDDMVTQAFFSGSYHFGRGSGFMAGGGYSHFQAWYDDLDAYDLTASMINLDARYRFSTVSLGLSYTPSFFWADSESYLHRHGITADAQWKSSTDLTASLSYTFNDNDYRIDDSGDGNASEIFFNAEYRILEKKGRIFGGVGYEDNNASHPDKYFGQFKSKLGVSLKIPFDITLRTTLKYNDKNYDNEDSRYKIKREDGKFSGSVSLSRSVFFDWLWAFADFTYAYNDSNIKVYTYERKTGAISFAAIY